MDFSVFEKLGLHRNDIRVYQALVVLGRSKTGPIAKRAEVTSSSVYESLRQLIKKGLVSFHVRNNIRYYQAEIPDQLIEEVEHYQFELVKLSQAIQSIPSPLHERNDTNTYEGRRGFQLATKQHLEACEEGEAVCIISFSTRLVAEPEIRSFYKRIDQEIVKRKKIRVRMLLDKRLAYARRDKTGIPHYEITFMPTGYFSPCAVNISKREVLLSVLGDQPTIFALHHQSIIQSFRQNFEFLWRMAK